MHCAVNQTVSRDRGDQCPGTLRLFTASDGHIGRVRAPGGYLPAEQWTALATMADELGDGDIHITSRGNLQIRGVTSTDDFAAAVTAAGLLPFPAHDRMRNYLASPLSGRAGSLGDVRPLVRTADRELTSHPELAGLPGRTLFAFDDGRGDVINEMPDFGVIATAADTFDLIVGGDYPVGSLARSRVVDALVALACRWQETRGDSWRIAEAAGAAEELAAWAQDNIAGLKPAVLTELPVYEKSSENSHGLRQPVGWIVQDDGRISLAMTLPLGRMEAASARLIGATGKPTTVTCWHGIVVHDLDEHEAEQVLRFLAPRGLVFDARSPWLRVTACTGLPGCKKSKADVRADAILGMTSDSLPAGRVHFVGCERRCGSPNMDFTEYLAEGEGEYEVTEVTMARPAVKPEPDTPASGTAEGAGHS